VLQRLFIPQAWVSFLTQVLSMNSSAGWGLVLARGWDRLWCTPRALRPVYAVRVPVLEGFACSTPDPGRTRN